MIGFIGILHVELTIMFDLTKFLFSSPIIWRKFRLDRFQKTSKSNGIPVLFQGNFVSTYAAYDTPHAADFGCWIIRNSVVTYVSEMTHFLFFGKNTLTQVSYHSKTTFVTKWGRQNHFLEIGPESFYNYLQSLQILSPRKSASRTFKVKFWKVLSLKLRSLISYVNLQERGFDKPII